MHYDLVVNKSLKQSLSQLSESLSLRVTSSVDVSILIMPPARAVSLFSFFAAGVVDSLGSGESFLSIPICNKMKC